MKKLLLFIFIGWMSASVADSSENTPAQNTKWDYETCQKYKDDQKLFKEDAGFYDFRLGTCQLITIHDSNSFHDVIEKFSKSASVNNYPMSYFALGLLFEEKYKLGSIYYGIKGTPLDLSEAIKNYEKAAQYGSSLAENALGEIYLNEINLSKKNQTKNSGDVKNENAPTQLPDINKALYWLTLAAKHGNSAAQGTLSDLYRQGIGVPQDYILAYVWENLSVASWVRFNKQPQDEMSVAYFKGAQEERDQLYKNLTPDQKNEATKLIKEYQKNYFIAPNQIDSACTAIRTAVLSINIQKILNKLPDIEKKANKELSLAATKELIKLCGANYKLDGNILIVNIDKDNVVNSIPLALKAKDVIYSKNVTQQDLESHPVTASLVAALKATSFILPLIYNDYPKLDNIHVEVYLNHTDVYGNEVKDLFFSFNMDKALKNKINWNNFQAADSSKVFTNFQFSNSLWIREPIKLEQ